MCNQWPILTCLIISLHLTHPPPTLHLPKATMYQSCLGSVVGKGAKQLRFLSLCFSTSPNIMISPIAVEIHAQCKWSLVDTKLIGIKKLESICLAKPKTQQLFGSVFLYYIQMFQGRCFSCWCVLGEDLNLSALALVPCRQRIAISMLKI